MASTSSLTWAAHYARHRDDGGAIQRSFKGNLGHLAKKTMGHLEDTEELTRSIAGSNQTNFMMVPGKKGRMHLLHHGFTYEDVDEGFSILFVQGNYPDSCNIKSLSMTEAIAPIRWATGRTKLATVVCPSLDRLLTANTAEEFAKLEAQGNDILKEMPNHLMVVPDVFLMAEGAANVKARDLAITFIEWVRTDPDEEDDEETADARKTLGEGGETLLAMLWASDQGRLTQVPLSDPPESPELNQIIRGIKKKVNPTPDRNEREGGRGNTDDDYPNFRDDAWAISSQSIVRELNRMHESRESEREVKEASQSLFKTLGPAEKELFTSLCTTDLSIEPEITQFMITLATVKTPQKAVGLIKTATRYWEGTFTEGCCHRLLSNGFLSQESNQANPGGFTVFMFHPKTVDTGKTTFDSSKATLREYFGVEVEDETIEFYAKQGFFHPTNQHDLRIQLQTALDMLELLTCKNSIATKGLHYILNPRRWSRLATVLHGRFQTDKAFGTKFLYSVDRALQIFFDRMSSDDSAEGGGGPNDTEGFLLGKAAQLISRIEEGEALTIELPVSLAQAAKQGPSQGGAKPSKKTKAATQTPSNRPAKKNAQGSPNPNKDHLNGYPHPGWGAGEGKDYLSLFTNRAPGTKNWPKFTDARLPQRNGQPRPAPMCVRFQMTGKCTQGCSLAHVHAKHMSAPEFQQVDRLIQEALRTAAPPTST